MGPTPSRTYEPAALAKAFVLFLLVAVLLMVADEASLRLTQHAWQRVVDDLLGGLIAGLIFYVYERRRLHRLRRHLQVIELMNHHIRNALQPILFVEYQEKTRIKLIEKCVDHIDWALREVLTGNTQEAFFPGRPERAGQGSFFHGWYDAWKKRNQHASAP